MPNPPAEGSTLTNRQLNRALLARQHLLARHGGEVADMLQHLVGMQSQVPKDPFIGLWTSLEGFRHDQLDRLMLERTAVRHTIMRGTIHLTTARDALAIRPAMQDMLERTFHQSATYAPRLEGLEIDDVVAAGRAMLEETPLTRKRLGERLAERWPGYPADALSAAVAYMVPLVQVTPRGTWRGSMQATLTTLDAWLGKTVDPYREPDEVILRYLRAFGPATVADAQAWSGLSGLREAVERLRPDLVTYRDERNRELFDVPDGLFPHPDAPAPVGFLPGFENALLSHADRTRIVSDEYRKALWKKNGLVDPTFLVDGYVAGSWKVANTKSEATLTVTPFVTISAADRAALEEEGARLLAFLEPDAPTRHLQFDER
jgi:hypothetical protein